MRAKFHVAEWGTMEYSDFVEVRLAACTSSSASSCGGYVTTKLLRDDFGGWYWQLVNGYWLSHLNPNHTHIRIKITMHSDVSYTGSSHYEAHILDNLQVMGWGCDKPVEKVVKCKTTSCSYSSGHTHVYSKMLNDNGTKNTSHERWTCAKAGRGCTCMCHSKYSCTLTHHHTSGYKRAFNHC